MTQNQIAWAKLSEEKRHNVVSEGETQRHNISDENIRYESNSIAQQGNLINQFHLSRMDTESKRHNRAQEKLSKTQNSLRLKELKESRRHAKRTEKISSYQAQEAKRHNLVMESIDWANVGISGRMADASQLQARSAYQNAFTNLMNAETRVDELDLAKDRYSLDQWRTINESSATKDKIQSETDLNKAKLDYQNLQNDYYLINQFGYVLDSLGPISPAGDMPNMPEDPKTKSGKSKKSAKTKKRP